MTLNSQLSAAFDAAALDHCAATFSGNARTETVCAGAVTRVWLVSSFWHIFAIVPILWTFYKAQLEFLPYRYSNIIILSTVTSRFSTY
jgi:hypothetical protein